MSVGWTPSLHPIYTEEDIVFEPALCGSWLGDDNVTILNIAPNTEYENAYNFSSSNNPEGSINLLVHLVSIDDHLFLDCYPPDSESNDIGDSLKLYTHAFFRVVQIEPDLIVRDMDQEWLKAYLKDNPDALRLDYVENVKLDCTAPVVTSSTEEIQAFMIEHLETEGAYGDPIVLHRVDEAPGTAEDESESAEE
jgi:hypothetical protein